MLGKNEEVFSPNHSNFDGPTYGTKRGSKKKGAYFGQSGTEPWRLMSGEVEWMRMSTKSAWYVTQELEKPYYTDFGSATQPNTHGNGVPKLSISYVQEII